MTAGSVDLGDIAIRNYEIHRRGIARVKSTDEVVGECFVGLVGTAAKACDEDYRRDQP